MKKERLNATGVYYRVKENDYFTDADISDLSSPQIDEILNDMPVESMKRLVHILCDEIYYKQKKINDVIKALGIELVEE